MAHQPLPVLSLPCPPTSHEVHDAGRGNYWHISLRGPNRAGEQVLALVRRDNSRMVAETGPVSLDFLAKLILEAMPLPPTTTRERIDYAAGQTERAIQALDKVHTAWANRREASDDTTAAKDRATLALHELAKCLYRDQAMQASYGQRATMESPPTDREAFHKAAIAQAGRHAQAHPHLVDEHSDADPGM